MKPGLPTYCGSRRQYPKGSWSAWRLRKRTRVQGSWRTRRRRCCCRAAHADSALHIMYSSGVLNKDLQSSFRRLNTGRFSFYIEARNHDSWVNDHEVKWTRGWKCTIDIVSGGAHPPIRAAHFIGAFDAAAAVAMTTRESDVTWRGIEENLLLERDDLFSGRWWGGKFSHRHMCLLSLVSNLWACGSSSTPVTVACASVTRARKQLCSV